MAPPYDLRSDTVSKPTPAMREAMAAAPVGDDCYGDDPSVQALERAVADRLGKDAAVLLPTGTMSNQLAVRLHARPGQTIACHETAHVRIHEDASAAALSGVQLMAIGGRTGYSVAQLEALVREADCGWPPVATAWLENTLGDAGGIPWGLREHEGGDDLQTLAAYARDRGLSVHLDGARLWNAHIATGTPLPDIAAVADTVSVSMSKGLGAPAGSLLVGGADWIERARGLRHGLGGSMRQSGILAAAGLHALEHQLPRLAEDHRRASTLATAIADLRGWTVHTPRTNMVIATVDDAIGSAETLCAPLREAGVLCHPNRYAEVRLVLHLGIDDAALEAVIETVRRVVPATVA
ncbi:MAG: threonine aldolase family protein [Myxococcota bacterium]